MSIEMPSQAMTPDQYWQQDNRRKFIRRAEDKARELALIVRANKLHSLLELGQIIGLDLQLNEMLLQIAQKACEVMEADRCSLFLHDPNTNELCSTVALGMGEQVIRIPSGVGVAGFCFQTGEVINLEDAYRDPRFNKEVDAHTGYYTRSLLCMPLYNKSGLRLGVVQLLNKKEGIFTEEDEAFLKTFGNHASVFIEMAQLQKARIVALEQSRRELDRLNRVKSKALAHLSHELRTPLAVVQGKLRLLKRRLQMNPSPFGEEELFDILERHLNRLLDIQQETDKIIRSYQGLEGSYSRDDLDRFRPISFQPIMFFPFAEGILEKVRERAKHRDIQFQLEGEKDLCVDMAPHILEDILGGLLKNAVENTPDGGKVRILLEKRGERVLLKVQDFGIGITEENQRHIFDGLFPTQEIELYASKRPYDFNAGGKGLDLLRMKVYGQRFGFDLSVESRRCIYLPTDRELCPGKISLCPHCRGPEDCQTSGGSIFNVSFPLTGGKSSEKI